MIEIELAIPFHNSKVTIDGQELPVTSICITASCINTEQPNVRLEYYEQSDSNQYKVLAKTVVRSTIEVPLCDVRFTGALQNQQV